MSKQYGIDVSHHQSPNQLRWDTIAETSSFCICRTSYGTMNDRRIAEHVREARRVGLAVGIYHFFRPHQPWPDQFAALRRQADIAGFGEGDVWPALDVEADPLPKPGTAVSPDWQPGVRAMLEALTHTYGGALVYITQREFGHLGGPAWLLNNHPLWVAHYTAKPAPATPSNAPWLLWQHRVASYDAAGPGGYFPPEPGRVQLDQNRLLGALPRIGRAIEEHDELTDESELAWLSPQAIAEQFPLEVDHDEIREGRDKLVREGDE